MRGASRKEWLGVVGMMALCLSIVVWPTLAESPAVKRLRSLSAADQKLVEAVKNEDLKGVKVALAQGANIDCQDRERFQSCTGNPPRTYYTPLMLSTLDPIKQRVTRNGKLKDFSIARLLIAKGANPNLMGNSYITPLWGAVASKNTDLAQTLLQAGAEVDLTEDGKNTPFLHAVFLGDLEMAKLLYIQGANINAVGELGMTALHRINYRAFSPEKLKMVRWLIDNHADVNAIESRGKTPLHYAIEYGHYEAVQLLVDAGADTKIKDVNGTTPLDMARLYALSSNGRKHNGYFHPNETSDEVQAKLIDVLENHGKTQVPQTNHA